MHERAIALAASAAVLAMPGSHALNAVHASTPARVTTAGHGTTMTPGATLGASGLSPTGAVSGRQFGSRLTSRTLAATNAVARFSHAVTAASGGPTLASRSPAPNKTGVVRTINVIVGFSEAVKITSTSVRLLDTKTGKYVSAKVTYKAATWKATLNPAPTLAAHRKYKVVVSGAKDGAGLVIKTTTWYFTTGN